MQCGKPQWINKGTANSNGTQYPNSLPFLAKFTALVINIPQPIASMPHPNGPTERRDCSTTEAASCSGRGVKRVIKAINKQPTMFPGKIQSINSQKSLFDPTYPAIPVNSFALYETTVAKPKIKRNIPIVLFAKNPHPAIPIQIPANTDREMSKNICLPLGCMITLKKSISFRVQRYCFFVKYARDLQKNSTQLDKIRYIYQLCIGNKRGNKKVQHAINR